MKEGFPDSDEAKTLVAQAEQITYLADGRVITNGHVSSLNMSDGEIKDVLAEVHGVGTGNIHLQPQPSDVDGRSKSVGFQRWNSPWHPNTPKGDPNLN